MFLRAQSGRSKRGQAMVEFAIVLPVLALLLVMAIDFGRVFFGWVGLQSGTRSAADFAARAGGSWDDRRDLYRDLVISDMVGINCAPGAGTDADGDGRWDPNEVPDPTFEDVDGNGVATDDGDHARVILDCSFPLITPLAGGVVGNPVSLRAESWFPINGVLIPALPTPEPTPPGPCPPPSANFTMAEDPASGDGADGRGDSPLKIDFANTSIDDPDCAIDEYAWVFGLGTGPGQQGSPPTSTEESPQDVIFTHPTGTGGPYTFTVRLTVTTVDGQTDEFTGSVRVALP